MKPFPSIPSSFPACFLGRSDSAFRHSRLDRESNCRQTRDLTSSPLPALLRIIVITSREIHSAQEHCLEAFAVASAVSNAVNFSSLAREMVIESILLPLAVANEFHGKCFLCVSDYFGVERQGETYILQGVGVCCCQF